MSRRPIRTAVVFSVLVFLILCATMFLTLSFVLFLYRTGVLTEHVKELPVLIFIFASIITGTLLSRFAGHHLISKIVNISDATKEIAHGNFDIKLDENIRIIELQEMARNFNIMTKELANTELLRNDFVENVSHEFKTPLAAIDGYVTLLQKKGLTEEKRVEYTQKILTNTKRLSALTGNILLLSRLEHQEMEIKKETYSLDEQIREVILLLENKWTEKNIELDIDLEECYYFGSQNLMEQVWLNILDNAVKYTPPEGKIRIQLKLDEGSAAVAISDNGPGMNEEVLGRVFEKFYQGDTSRSSPGNGLGLALAKRVVELHKGTITAASSESGGSTFTVKLNHIISY